MAFGVSRAFAAPLLLFNFSLYVIVVCIAGWALNVVVNHDDNWSAVSNSPATHYFVIFALIAGVVGIASKISGCHHLKSWQDHSLAGTTAAAFIAWLLTLLAMGLACKEIHLGGVRYKRMKVLEAAVIILSGTQLFYLLAVGAGIFSGEYTPPPPPPAGTKDGGVV